MSNAEERIIITPFPSGDKMAMEVIDSVMGQLSDGMWENSNNRSIKDMWSCTDVEDDGKNIILKLYNKSSYSYGSPYNSWFRADEKKIFDYIASHAKQVVKFFEKEEGSDYAWSRTNNNEAFGFGGHGVSDIKISDVYRVYDILKGRKMRDNTPANKKSTISINDMIDSEKANKTKEMAQQYLNSLLKFSETKEFKDDINGKMRDTIRVQITALSSFISAIEKQESLIK